MISIVLQVGTRNSKVGFGSQSQPRMSTESVLIDSNNQTDYLEEGQQLFAHHTQRQFAVNLDTSRKDASLLDIYEKVWSDEDNHLGLSSCKIKSENYCKFIGELIAEIREGNHSECGVLLIQPSYIPSYDLTSMRTTICQYLLDQLNLQSIYFLKSAVSSNFAQGTTSGIVVDSGESFTTVARVHDGYQDSVKVFNFGANMLNHSIQKYLERKGVLQSLTHRSHEGSENLRELIRGRELRDIKEQLFRESEEIENQRVVQVELPDKQTIKIDKEDIHQPFTEVNSYKQHNDFVFPTHYRGLSHSIAELMEDSKEKVKSSLGKYITFTGGNFLYKDIAQRAETQLSKSAVIRGLGEVHVVNNHRKLDSSWIGGSIVSSLSSFDSFWVSSKEWKENGPSIIAKKCP